MDTRTSLCMVEEEEEEVAALCSPDPASSAEPHHLTQKFWSSTGSTVQQLQPAELHRVTLLSLKDKLARC